MLDDINKKSRALKALRASESRLRQVWEMSSDAMAISDAQGIVLDVNPAYLRLYGFSAEQVIGQSFAIIFPEERQQRALQRYKAVYTSEAPPASFESVVRRADGTELIVEARASFLTTAGQRTAMLSTIRDITERKRAEETAAYLTAIVQASGDAILGLSADGLIQSWNPAAEHLFGYRAVETMGQPITLVTASDRHDEIHKALARVCAGETVRLEITGITKEGEPVALLMNTAPVIDTSGKILGISAVLTDFTMHKQAQLAELQHRLIQSQEEERGHLARELHDGPLQELVALSFELASLRLALPEELQQSYLTPMEETLKQTNRHLRQIAVDLRPPVLDFGLVAAIRQCVEEFRHRQAGHIIEMTVDQEIAPLPEPVVLALYRICKQSLHNVAQHAAATHVLVRLQGTANELALEIEDNGQGFIVPDSWTEFAHRHHLGVAGMAERAHALGGSLLIRSQPGEGTLVRVTIPLHRSER